MSASRAEAGLTAPARRDDLDRLALDHAHRMAARREIFHNDDLFTPATKQRVGANRIGENVAVNTSIDDAHRRLMASPRHRANLLDPGFTVIGLGVARDRNGRLFVTEVFIEPRTSTRPAATTGDRASRGRPGTAGAPASGTSGDRIEPTAAPAAPAGERGATPTTDDRLERSLAGTPDDAPRPTRATGTTDGTERAPAATSVAAVAAVAAIGLAFVVATLLLLLRRTVLRNRTNPQNRKRTQKARSGTVEPWPAPTASVATVTANLARR